jgi:hypothetical protein
MNWLWEAAVRTMLPVANFLMSWYNPTFSGNSDEEQEAETKTLRRVVILLFLTLLSIVIYALRKPIMLLLMKK